MNLPQGMDRSEAIDGLTFTLVQIADRFGNIRFDGITLAGSQDLSENAGYVLAILRGHYDHATLNRTLSDDNTPFNEFAGSRIYVPGSIAIYAPSDDTLIFAASPKGTPPVQAVITAARPAPTSQPATKGTAGEENGRARPTGPAPDEPVDPRLETSADMVSLITSLDTTQPLWLAVKAVGGRRSVPGLAALDRLTLNGRPARDTPLELHLEAKLADPAAAKGAAAAITALLPPKTPGATTQALAGERPASSPLVDTITAALAVKAVNVDGDRVTAAATFTLTRADILRMLLTSMDRPPGHKQ